MISRIIRLLAFLMLLSLVLYVVLLNREPITVHLNSDTSYSAMGGVVLIITFGLGLIAASLVGAFFGVKSYFRERRLHSRERQRKALYEGLLQARCYAASQNWTKARYEFEQVVHDHPNDIVSRVELSKVLERQGDPREALRVLDAARAEAPTNVEVLLRAADLNIALKNRTAAIDNLALVLLHQPNAYAARLARDLSEGLERYDDALEYQERVDALGQDEDETTSVRAKLQFKKMLKEYEGNPQGLKEALTAAVKKDPCPQALLKLADLESEIGSKETAAQLYARVGRETHSAAVLRKAIDLWIELNTPQQALAAARAAIKESTGQARVDSEFELIRAFISLNMLEEAKGELKKIPALLGEAGVESSPEISREVLTLQARMYAKLGDTAHTDAALKALSDGAAALEEDVHSFNGSAVDAPAPRLSTP